MNTCKSCGTEIYWTVTEAGKRMPVDVAPSSEGTIRLTSDGKTTWSRVLKGDELKGTSPLLLHRSHFATCRNAATHRRKDKS